ESSNVVAPEQAAASKLDEQDTEKSEDKGVILASAASPPMITSSYFGPLFSIPFL
ncbi:unnamed protein product, partial [Choristocarpus tenellus]